MEAENHDSLTAPRGGGMPLDNAHHPGYSSHMSSPDPIDGEVLSAFVGSEEEFGPDISSVGNKSTIGEKSFTPNLPVDADIDYQVYPAITPPAETGFLPDMSVPLPGPKLKRRESYRRPPDEVVQHFGDLELKVVPGVLMPDSSSAGIAWRLGRMLHESMEDMPDRFRRPLCIADVGSGTGVMAIVISRELTREIAHGEVVVVATDIDQKAVDLTQENAQRNGVKIIVEKRDKLVGFQQDFGSLDLLMTNPPWYPSGFRPELPFLPSNAIYGGEDGLEFQRDLFAQAAQVLSERGSIALRAGYRIRDVRAGLAEAFSGRPDFSGLMPAMLFKDWNRGKESYSALVGLLYGGLLDFRLGRHSAPPAKIQRVWIKS